MADQEKPRPQTPAESAPYDEEIDAIIVPDEDNEPSNYTGGDEGFGPSAGQSYSGGNDISSTGGGDSDG